MKILLANPRGFCAGVERAIKIVNYALLIYGPPIYVWHEIVHNEFIINEFKKKGVIFTENLKKIRKNSILIFSAHGVSEKIKKKVKKLHLKNLFDATCPLVSNIHMEVKKASLNNKEIIFIGNAGHQEVKGTIGQYYNKNGGIYLVESKKDIWKLKIKNEQNLYYITQTTLSKYDTMHIVKEIYKRFPNIQSSKLNNICYATINRQEAIYNLAKKTDIILIVGSKNSSNANRLKEISEKIGKPSYLINSYHDINIKWIKNIKKIGITAGASVPNIIIDNIITFFKKQGINKIIELNGKNENVNFKLPRNLQKLIKK
ncbi:MAG: 4-hydroxy-3-methylbut-2-enyl diphosphate reductase [Arsenophonus sp.]|nr:MAG: 4-hydroxy-3-methylbut-2-enyl diphosphate reductase [Arsenophonus sp.]